MVDTAASPSGIAATAKLTAVINISIGFLPYNIPIANIIAQITNATIPSVFPSWFSFFCSGVSTSWVSLRIPAILPTSVFIPILHTIPNPLPYVIKLDENSMFLLSPIPISFSSIASAIFSTGTDSPVNDDSCDFKFTASTNLKSAGT